MSLPVENGGTPMPPTALTIRLEQIKSRLYAVENKLENYESALGEYTLPNNNAPAGEATETPSRATVSNLLYSLEHTLYRIEAIQENLANVIL